MLGVGFALFALAPLAVFVVAVVVSVMVVATFRARVSFGAVHLGGAFQRVGLGEELLHRVHQVADPTWALVPLLAAGGSRGCALVLQRVESVSVDGKLLFKLVQEVGGYSVHFPRTGNTTCTTSSSYSTPSNNTTSTTAAAVPGIAILARTLMV